MIALEIVQGTAEWLAARCGTPSASNFDKIVTTTGAPSKQAQKYMYKLAGERITGMPEEAYQNGAMLRGIEMEAEARSLYEMIHDIMVDQTGICYPDEAKLFSCSPDGLVGDDGLIEIKCPEIQTHVEYLLAGTFPMDYFQQVQGQLFVTGRKWVDFISYYPGLKPLIIRVERNEKFISALESELVKFCTELEKVVEKIR
jgi:putative phage-type endonuclease